MQMMSRDRWMAVNYNMPNIDKYISTFEGLIKMYEEIKEDITKFKMGFEQLPEINKHIQQCKDKIKEISGV